MNYYKINPLVLFRHYGDFGYITDNRNFGYNFTYNHFTIGDQIISESGADILSCLEKTPLSIDEITNRVSSIFPLEEKKILQKHIINFLDQLDLKGFVIKEILPKKNKIPQIENDQPIKELDNSIIETQEFLGRRFLDTPFPTSIHVEIVSECNERCIHCYIPHELKTDKMDPKLFYHILEEAQKMNLLHITISGGEPMLHPYFIDFIKKCRECDLSVNILSNLTYLNEDMIQEMKKNPLLSVQTSIYSMEENIHDYITQHKNSLTKTRNAVVQLIKNGIPVQISCPIMNINYDSYKEVEKWGHQNNISVGSDFSIIAKYNHNKENINYRLNTKKLQEYISDKIKNDTSYLIELEKEISDNQQKTSEDYLCSICTSSICITPQGLVFPCVGWSEKIVGNIKDNSLQDIWLKSKKIKKLRSIKRKDLYECSSCKQKDFCSICMVKNANESNIGNPLEVNKYFCNIAKIKQQIYNKYNQLKNNI